LEGTTLFLLSSDLALCIICCTYGKKTMREVRKGTYSGRTSIAHVRQNLVNCRGNISAHRRRRELRFFYSAEVGGKNDYCVKDLSNVVNEIGKSCSPPLPLVRQFLLTKAYKSKTEKITYIF
jgi:hypothetical protein